ncbi:MAG: hypothetical protein WKF84_10810 [Pyrinomonadaceae bacterium]
MYQPLASRWINSITILFIALLLLPIPTPSQQQNASLNSAIAATGVSGNDLDFRKPAEGITAAQLKDYLEFIASDELEGRDTPSRGLNIAAKFIATNLSRWGVKGAGDSSGGYFQKIDLRLVKFDTDKSRIEMGGQILKLGQDFLSQPIPAEVQALWFMWATDGLLIQRT